MGVAAGAAVLGTGIGSAGGRGRPAMAGLGRAAPGADPALMAGSPTDGRRQWRSRRVTSTPLASQGRQPRRRGRRPVARWWRRSPTRRRRSSSRSRCTTCPGRGQPGGHLSARRSLGITTTSPRPSRSTKGPYLQAAVLDVTEPVNGAATYAMFVEHLTPPSSSAACARLQSRPPSRSSRCRRSPASSTPAIGGQARPQRGAGGQPGHPGRGARRRVQPDRHRDRGRRAT